MIAIVPASHSTTPRAPRPGRPAGAWQQRYLRLWPTIRRIAQYAFRVLSLDRREEAVQEVIASTFLAYARLVERGKESDAYAWPLARYAVAQYRVGRRVGSRLDIQDVMSPYCQQHKDVVLESLFPRSASGDWEQLAIEDKHATPADVAATRLDFRAWLGALDCKQRAAAQLLAGGATTADVSQQLRLSQGRVSQLRRELEKSWEKFQGETKQLSAA